MTPLNKTGLFALLTVVWSAVMLVQIHICYQFPWAFPNNLANPVLAIELAHNKAQIMAVVCPDWYDNDCEIAWCALQLNTILDLVFIPFYAGFLWFLLGLFGRGWGRSLVIAAALADYVEDAGIFTHAEWTWVVSTIKWLALGLSFVAVAGTLFASANDTISMAGRRILGLLMLGAGVLMWAAMALRYSWIPLSLNLFSVLPLVLATVWLGPWLQARLGEPLDKRTDPCG